MLATSVVGCVGGVTWCMGCFGEREGVLKSFK